MRRRDVLRSSAGALALAGLGGVASAAEASYAPRGEVAVEGAQEVETTTDGTFAAVAAGDGFAMIDVNDPANPSIASEHGDLLSDHDAGPMQMIADVKIDGDRLLVTGPNNAPQQGELVKAALLYDISDPANPTQLDSLTVDHPIHNSFYGDGYAYLTISDFDYEGFKMVDTSGDELEVVSEFSIVDHDDKWEDVHGFLRSCHDLYVQDDVAYLAQWDAGTFMVDVSDPQNPSVIGRAGGLPADELSQVTRQNLGLVGLQPPGNSHYVRPDEDANYLYKGAESWDGNPDDDKRGASGITVYDISDTANPEEVARIHPPGSEDEGRGGQFTTSHNFSIRGDRLFSSWYYGGVMVHDVSDPANPERLSWWRKPSETMFWGAKVAGDRDFFVAGNMQGSVMTFPTSAGEMSDPPGAFTPPEETSIVTDIDWSKYTASETTTTTTADPTTTEPTTTEPTTEPTTTEPTTEPTTASGGDGQTTAGDDTTTESSGSPGFGALAAAGGIGLGAARLLADDDDASEE
ncbi:hypothetical protein G9C85_10740 [Halorubellus sp. JP-L1]|uniref:LVIVD repeat-containing protein n=1 Tax=Halorubellus sp. JP-L1 TaxID=2715753 RepID=UPI00140997BB|nr:hypothetical protein [Halorubellus sp. JP-L1]NHN42102.1 hypothetical protein [Halorubellus sp. JP-L1]